MPLRACGALSNFFLLLIVVHSPSGSVRGEGHVGVPAERLPAGPAGAVPGLPAAGNSTNSSFHGLQIVKFAARAKKGMKDNNNINISTCQ